MKLNYDCVRDTLLVLEEITGFHPGTQVFRKISPDDIHEHLPDYTMDDIAYTVCELLDAAYIEGNYVSGIRSSTYIVSNITWAGHEFLKNIASESIWKESLEAIRPLGSVSLSILAQVASAAIMRRLGI